MGVVAVLLVDRTGVQSHSRSYVSEQCTLGTYVTPASSPNEVSVSLIPFISEIYLK